MSKRYRIAVYIRLSMEDLNLAKDMDKEESLSISNQRRFIHDYIEQREELHNAVILEFTDDGYSGTNFERPGVKAMLAACRQAEIDCIIVKDLSRFGRNYIETGDYLEQIFPSLGVRFISINDGFDSKNYAGQTGGMDAAFKNFIYEMYSRDLSEKVKSGVKTCMKRGEYYAGCIVYGYEKSPDGKNMVIDEKAAEVIRRIFNEMAGGENAKQLSRALNGEGIPTRLTYKQSKGEQLNRHYGPDSWDKDKIYSIIHNAVYQGDMVYRKALRPQMGRGSKTVQPENQWIVIPDHHEAIISRETFKQANAHISKRRPAEYDRCNVKRGSIFCGYCGKRLELHQTKQPYYVCRRRNMVSDVPCSSLRIEKAELVRLIGRVWLWHCRYFEKASLTMAFRRSILDLQKQEKNLNMLLKQTPVEKLHLYERFCNQLIDKGAFLREKELSGQKEEEIKRRLTELAGQIETLHLKMKSCNETNHELNKPSEELIREFVEKVIVYEDKRVEILWRYEDGVEKQ